LKNLTTGSPTRVLLRFTLPLIIGGLLQQAYQITDAIVVGRVLGPLGLAAIGSVGSLIFLLKGFGWGSTAGLAIPVAKAFGADDLSETRRMIAGGAFVAFAIGMVVSLIGLILGRPILQLMALPHYLLDNAATYLQILIAGSLLSVTFAFLGSIIRAVGDSKTPLYFGIASQILNAGLTIWFVAFLNLGIVGAATSTLIAQAISLTLALRYFTWKMPQLIPSKAEWQAGFRAVTIPARTGLPMGLQTCGIAIGVVILQAAVNTLGSDAMAAYAAIGRVEGIAISPLHAFNAAMVTFVAQNRGAEKWLRIRHTVNRAVVVICLVAVALGSIQFLFTRALVGAFLPASVGAPFELAVGYLQLTAFMFAILGLKFIIRGAVQGMGNSAVPTASTFVELTVRAVLAFWLVNRFGLAGIAIASPLAWTAGMSLNLTAWVKLRRSLLQKHKAQLTLTGGSLPTQRPLASPRLIPTSRPVPTSQPVPVPTSTPPPVATPAQPSYAPAA